MGGKLKNKIKIKQAWQKKNKERAVNWVPVTDLIPFWYQFLVNLE